MVVTDARWAAVWFGIDLVVLLVRLVPTIRHERRGGALPDPVARMIVCLAFCLLLMFSLGCSAAVLTEQKPLAIVATASMMGLVAGLATRWAALPRLALTAVVLFVDPILLCGGDRRAGRVARRRDPGRDDRGQRRGAERAESHDADRAAPRRTPQRRACHHRYADRSAQPRRSDRRTRPHPRAGRCPIRRSQPLFIDLDAFKAINGPPRP